ncbi:MAG: CDF family Co(II)/Ni(II) efflux transporter DmeF [Spirochaetales bacterium]|nr:CDF family Co(II)/Ni(II) efflux transporter DmeF [Spirochaetales bacterium]
MTERICNQQQSEHSHNHSNMKKTALVVSITLLTMIAEIGYGIITGSMSLLADGIHMGTHTFALIVTLIAYMIAGKQADNPNFTFSSGKVGILGGYTNAILLGITALYMIYEAIFRLIHPEEIIFNQALIVAGIGLTVNLISAALLSAGDHDHHHHGHDHGHHHGHEHHDHNLRAAYIHVLTDALTSVLAIAALLFGKVWGQTWPDALVAILGAVVILKWAYGLLVSSGALLVDYYPLKEDCMAIQALLEESGSLLRDLHIWRISENHKALILTVKGGEAFKRNEFLRRMGERCEYAHVTLEVV